MLHAIALSSVLSVRLDSSHTFRGKTYGATTVKIDRQGSAFVEDGHPANAQLIQSLLDALDQPDVPAPSAANLAADPGWPASAAQQEMQRCDGALATGAATQAYTKAFSDAQAFAGFVSSYYAKPADPNAALPLVRVIVNTTGGPVVATSSSRKALMLPFSVSQGSAAAQTYNGAIARAIAALLPPQDNNQNLLSLRDLEWQWAINTCSDAFQQFALESYLPLTAQYARDHGLTLKGSLSGQPVDGLTAWLGPTDQPRIRMLFNADISGGDQASLAAMGVYERVLHAVARLPWLQRVLSQNPSATVDIDDPAMAGGFLEAGEVDELANAGFPQAATVLRNNLRDALSFWVWLKPDKEATQYYLLPSGDSLLVHYLPAEERLPFAPAIAARIHKRGVPFDGGPTITVGVFVSPDGSVHD